MPEGRLRVGLFCVGWELGARGGVQVYVHDLVAALGRYDASGNEYTLLVGRDDPEPPRPGPRFSVARLPVAALPARSTWRERARKLRLLVPALPSGRDAVAREIDALSLDVVHFPSTTMPLGGRTPAVVTFFDMQEEFLPQLFSRRERLSRRARNRRGVAQARIVVSPSAFTANCLRERYGTPAGKVRIIPPGIDERFGPDPTPGERSSLVARHGPLPAAFALYPAHPWPHKNHFRLFRASRLAAQALGHPIPIVCTGTLGTTGPTLQSIARAADFPLDQIADLGFVARELMPALYRAARILVFPSLFEGFGLPVLEALASGCPAVSSSTTALAELAAYTWTVDPTDEHSIADGITKAWSTPNERQGWRDDPRSAAFRWDRLVERLLDAYADASARATAE